MTEVSPKQSEPFDYLLENPTPGELREAVDARGGRLELRREDRDFIDEVLRACDKDDDIIKRVVDIESKLREAAPLTGEEFIFIHEQLGRRGFLTTGLGIVEETFNGPLRIRGLTVAGDLNLDKLLVEGGMSVENINASGNVMIQNAIMKGDWIIRGIRAKRLIIDEGISDGSLVVTDVVTDNSTRVLNTNVGWGVILRDIFPQSKGKDLFSLSKVKVDGLTTSQGHIEIDNVGGERSLFYVANVQAGGDLGITNVTVNAVSGNLEQKGNGDNLTAGGALRQDRYKYESWFPKR